MPIVPTEFPGHYVAIAEFQGPAGIRDWRSEFHIEGASGVTPQPNDAIINAIQNYWIHNLRNDAVLGTIQLRNWTYGPQPFAIGGGLPIWTKSVNIPGDKPFVYGAQGPNAAGREVVGFVKIETSGGRPGKQFLRVFLDELDITAVPGGEWSFDASPPANITPAKYHTDAAALLGPFNASANPPRLCVVHFSTKKWNANPIAANGPFSTPMTDIFLERPGVNKSTRKNKK
jgi:hypothetical protein